MPEGAVPKASVPVPCERQASFSVGSLERQSRADTILSPFPSVLEPSIALTPWTTLLGPPLLDLQILMLSSGKRNELSMPVFLCYLFSAFAHPD